MRFLGIEINRREEIPAGVSRRRSDPGFSDEYYTSFSAWASGRGVNPASAMRSSAVYSCVRLIAETIASLPLFVYRRLPNGGKVRAPDHPLYRVLAASPNLRNSPMEFKEVLVWHLLLRGNAYVLNKDVRGRTELEILNPDCVRVEVSPQGILTYYYKPPGAPAEVKYRYQIVHVRGPGGDDGIIGRSPIDVARETVYRAMTMETFHTKTYENGTRLSGILEAEGELDDEVAERLTKSFRDAYGGPHNAGKVALLEDKVKFKQVSMTLEQAEFIEGRKLTRSEIAGIFGVPPHMIGDLDRATFSNIENQSINFLTYTLRSWLVRIEQAFMRDLFVDDEERDEFFIEFLPDALLRGDTISRYTAHGIGLEKGFLTFNEAREMENRNPFGWGDSTMVPLNNRLVGSDDTVDDIKAQAAPAAKPAPAANQEGGDQIDQTDQGGDNAKQD